MPTLAASSRIPTAKVGSVSCTIDGGAAAHLLHGADQPAGRHHRLANCQAATGALVHRDGVLEVRRSIVDHGHRRPWGWTPTNGSFCSPRQLLGRRLLGLRPGSTEPGDLPPARVVAGSPVAATRSRGRPVRKSPIGRRGAVGGPLQRGEGFVDPGTDLLSDARCRCCGRRWSRG